MNVANAEFEATAEQFRKLATRTVNQADLRKYVRRVMRCDDDSSTKLKNIVDEIVRRAEEGIGTDIPKVRGTLWAAYNGVTEHLSYARGRTAETRMDSLWFGDGSLLNQRALEVALEMAC